MNHCAFLASFSCKKKNVSVKYLTRSVQDSYHTVCSKTIFRPVGMILIAMHCFTFKPGSAVEGEIPIPDYLSFTRARFVYDARKSPSLVTTVFLVQDRLFLLTVSR